MFSDLTKSLSLAFRRHCLKEAFQTLGDYNLAGGLAVQTRFDYLDRILRSQACQIHNLQIVFRFLSTVVKWCMLATHIKDIKHGMLCVTGVYLRDITDTIW